MADMKIKHGHGILTPGNEALAIKPAPRVGQPDLLTKRTRDRSFLDLWPLDFSSHSYILYERPILALIVSQAWDHHEPPHGQEEDDRVEKESRGRRGTHGI